MKLRNLHRLMRPIRWRGLPISRVTIVMASAVALTFCAARPAQAQAQPANALPHAWSEAVYAIAQKSAAAMTPVHAFSAEVNDVSQAAPVELASVRRAFEDDMVARGMRPIAAPADTQIVLSISHTLTGFTLVAQIRRGDASQVVVAPVANDEPVAPQPGSQPGLQRKLVWQQVAPLLDFDQIAGDSNQMFWYFLEPERLVVFEFEGGQQVIRDSEPIPRRYATRDLRGWISATDATHLSAFVGGGRCDAAWNPSLAMDCRDNASEQWPVGPASWTFVPGRNYFSGTVTLSSSLQAKFPPFFSSASPQAATSGQGASRRVIAGLDGEAEFFDGTAEPVSAFDDWGSDIVSIAGACGANWEVLATGKGDWTEKDQIQLYEIRDRKAVALGQPLELPGPTLAAWSSDEGKSARLISRNLETGLYEASIISVGCGN
jgi:hypothetical protein